MGRRSRPTSARQPLAALLLALCVAGCSNTSWSLSAGAPPAPAQPLPPGGSLNVTTGTSVLATFLTLGLINYFMSGGTPFYAAPPMDPERRVADQDCTRPIEESAANLRCR